MKKTVSVLAGTSVTRIRSLTDNIKDVAIHQPTQGKSQELLVVQERLMIRFGRLLTVSILLSLLATSTAWFPRRLCQINPSALPFLCRKHGYGKSCPTVSWGDWKVHEFSPQSKQLPSCHGEQLLRYRRTKDVTSLSSSCRLKVLETTQTEDRCKLWLV